MEKGAPGGRSRGKSAPHSFAVIPAKSLPPAKAGAGIQWHSRDTRLDPGSALRAVRDDVRRGVRRPG